MLFLTVGTGLGGGLVLDGEIYRGPTGMGAELGHMIVDPLGPAVRLRAARLPGGRRLGYRADPDGPGSRRRGSGRR